jgi:hypothetical protein
MLPQILTPKALNLTVLAKEIKPHFERAGTPPITGDNSPMHQKPIVTAKGISQQVFGKGSRSAVSGSEQ